MARKFSMVVQLFGCNNPKLPTLMVGAFSSATESTEYLDHYKV